MNANWSRRLVITGLVLMLAGALDPLEGCVVILGGTATAALGAFLSRSHYRLPLVSVALTAAGVAVLFGFSAFGGVGGNSGRSLWWLLLCVPYPIGWILGLIGATQKLREPRTTTPASTKR
jgi:hypothetical protein